MGTLEMKAKQPSNVATGAIESNNAKFNSAFGNKLHPLA